MFFFALVGSDIRVHLKIRKFTYPDCKCVKQTLSNMLQTWSQDKLQSDPQPVMLGNLLVNGFGTVHVNYLTKARP